MDPHSGRIKETLYRAREIKVRDRMGSRKRVLRLLRDHQDDTLSHSSAFSFLPSPAVKSIL